MRFQDSVLPGHVAGRLALQHELGVELFWADALSGESAKGNVVKKILAANILQEIRAQETGNHKVERASPV